MNFIKTLIPKKEYTEIQKLGNKYVLRMLPEEDDDNYLCIETIVEYEPTKDQYDAIKDNAKSYYVDIQNNTDIIAYKSEISELKRSLSDTDYIAIKFAEGWITEDEYAPVKAERQSWRDRINELELLIETDK